MKKPIIFFLLLACCLSAGAWGFLSHQRINSGAISILPPGLHDFYQYHSKFIEENSTNPDKRRKAVKGEAELHFIDIDAYGDSGLYTMPHDWNTAVARYSRDTLLKYGTVPWQIDAVRLRLTKAFKKRDLLQILLLSSDLGHYVADAHVPLHTTINYDGQMTEQKGIHAFWETRLPELYINTYNLRVDSARYLDNPLEAAWQAVADSHAALDSVLDFERQLTPGFAADRKFTMIEYKGKPSKIYSEEFSKAYHEALKGQVERRMRASIKLVGDFWYTCWADAGKPDLKALARPFSKKERKTLEKQMERWEVK